MNLRNEVSSPQSPVPSPGVPLPVVQAVVSSIVELSPVHPECAIIDPLRLAARFRKFAREIDKADAIAFEKYKRLCGLMEKIFPGATECSAVEHSKKLRGN